MHQISYVENAFAPTPAGLTEDLLIHPACEVVVTAGERVNSDGEFHHVLAVDIQTSDAGERE